MEPAPFHQLPDDSLTTAQSFWASTDDGLRLRLTLWRGENAPLGTILLFSGRTEYAEKYAPLAHDLNAAGFAVLTLDWRGQGLSDRLQDDPVPGHVGDFADYQRDVVEMVVAGTELDLPRPWHLLAHSMGGAIGLAALHNGLPVKRAVFSAPMWGIDLGRLPEWLVSILTRQAIRMGKGGRIAPQKGGARSYVLDGSFNANLLTHDVDNWTRMVRQAATWPELTIGGASFGWVHHALQECRRLSEMTPPAIPTLIGLGSDEGIVSPAAIRRLADQWPSARLTEIAGARHEILAETPQLRQTFLDAVLDHFMSET